MKRVVQRVILRTFLLCKRLYKKPTFLAILVLVPLVAFGYSAIDREDSGMVTVALAKESEDALADAVIADLKSDSRMIRYVLTDAPEQAQRLVETGKADAAWIFPAHLQQAVQAYLDDPAENGAFIRVVQREDAAGVTLIQEKLSTSVYRCCVKMVYRNYIRENFPSMATLSDDALMTYYEKNAVGGEMFVFEDVNATVDAAAIQRMHFLTAPVRGLLACVIVLAGLATAMYYIRDQRNGTFARIRSSRLPFAEGVCQAITVIHIELAVWLALLLVSAAVAWWRELAITVCGGICVTAFCMLLRRLCGSEKLLAALLPLLMTVMLIVCPVFFEWTALQPLSLLFPPTYYICAAYDNRFLWYMPLYAAVCFGLYAILGKCFKRQ